jgi:uncharacterized protein DUF6438
VRALLVAVAACSAPATTAPLTNAAPEKPTTVLRMERTECLGACPEYTIEITSNGDVRWHGEANVLMLGDRMTRIEPANVRRLLDAFERAGFFELEMPPKAFRTDCSSGRCLTIICNSTDAPTTKITVARDGRTNTYEAQACGGDLDKAEDLVDELSGAKAWIGQRADDDEAH